jgi:DNA polymerase III epsilon subunit-like protein
VIATRHCMLDLETMDTRTTAAIVSIGAVLFTTAHGIDDRDPFYRTVSLQSNSEHGLTMNPATIMWWMEQSDATRDELLSRDSTTLATALLGFTSWLSTYVPQLNEVLMWGNGAGFDNPILANAFHACRLPVPWNFRNDRCFRTLRALYPTILPPTAVNPAPHHALSDARWQAEHAVAILRHIENSTPTPLIKDSTP